jgi:outer membrane lipoprotein-sorting protein
MKKNYMFFLIFLGVFVNYSYANNINEFIENVNKEDSSTIIYSNNSSKNNNIINYLNSIKTMVADFIQIAPDGTSSEGKFFLARPGKLRWQYEPPVPLLIIVNGNSLLHYDYELNESTYTETEQIMGSFLTAENINFSDKNLIAEYNQKNSLIRLRVTNKINNQKQSIKEMVLVFSSSPLQLKKIEFTDQESRTTSVSFHNILINVDIDKKIFNFNSKNIK